MTSQTAKKSTKGTAKKTAKKTQSKKEPAMANPFQKTKKSPDKKKSGSLEPVDSHDEIVKAGVDEFNRVHQEIKRLEGEKAAHKEIVEVFAKAKSAEKRFYNGETENFRILGNETTVQFQVQSKSKQFTEEGLEQFREKHGDEAADDLFEVDTKTVQFNEEFLKQGDNMEKLMQALGSLGQEFVDNCFTAATYKIKKDALDRAMNYAEDSDELNELYQDMQVTRFIKS